MPDCMKSVEDRLGALERALLVAMGEVDDTRAALTARLNEYNANQKQRFSAEPCVPLANMEEIVRMASEAFAAATAQKDRLLLHGVRHEALVREVNALRARMSELSHAQETFVEDPRHWLPKENCSGDLSGIRTRVEELERQQAAPLDRLDERIHSLVISLLHQIHPGDLQEQQQEEPQQQQQQEDKGSNATNGLTSANDDGDPTNSGAAAAEHSASRLFSAVASPPPSRPANAAPDLCSLRSDLAQCVLDIEYLKNQQQRQGVALHGCLASVKREKAQFATDLNALRTELFAGIAEIRSDVQSLSERLRRCEETQAEEKVSAAQVVVPFFRGDGAARHTPLRAEAKKRLFQSCASGLERSTYEETEESAPDPLAGAFD